MATAIVPVILAGGQGTRLWPLSRSARPKQFLNLMGESSLFAQTLARVADRDRYAPPIVITNADYRFLVAEQAQEAEVPLSAVLLEPVARNTAPAIAAAALHAVSTFGDDAVLNILPSDHAIEASADYVDAVDRAARVARSGRLVTFGIVPRYAETGYGYIEAGVPLTNGALEVARFIEKPDLRRAEEMVATGKYSWNSGMFMLGAKTFLDELEALSPDTYAAAAEAVAKARQDLDFIRLDPQAFVTAPNISVDYAVFEKTRLAAVLPVTFPWSDLGSWDAVWKMSPRDAGDNTARGPVTLSNTTHSLVVSEGAHVAVEGLDDVAVIASDDAIFVGRLSEAQKVGPLVKRLKQASETAPLTETHRTSYRPWGGYSSLVIGDRFQVKRLFVKPGKRLSLQKHHHRSEHWVVVRGTAEVTVDGQVSMLTENQSVYLPLGCTHRLANPGEILLELIEVQTGSYLGEDDIIRIEDEFGRA
jgi:mannose-1-phosphate guanylyltransferase